MSTNSMPTHASLKLDSLPTEILDKIILEVLGIHILAISAKSGQSKDNISTSEIEECTKAYHMIDKRGYVSEAIWRAMQWGYQIVDQLIDHCREIHSRKWIAYSLFEMLANERGDRNLAEEKVRILAERLHTLESEYQTMTQTERSQQEEVEAARLIAQIAQDAALSAEWNAEFLRAELDEYKQMNDERGTTKGDLKDTTKRIKHMNAVVGSRASSKQKRTARLLKF